MERLIQLAIADNQEIFRDGIRAAMKNKDYIRIQWEAEDSKGMMQKLKLKTPDVLLADIKMPGTDTIKDIQSIKKEYKELKVIILSSDDNKDTIAQVMEYGANAYLAKNTDAEEVFKAIITCVHHDFYFNDLVNAAVLSKLQQNKAIQKLYPKPAKFNEKELKVLELISEDKTTDEISNLVFLSPRTVETIRQNMKMKVGAKTIAGLLMYAIRNKLVQIIPKDL